MVYIIWPHSDKIKAATCDLQQCCILKSVDSDEPVHPMWMYVCIRGPEKNRSFSTKAVVSPSPLVSERFKCH